MDPIFKALGDDTRRQMLDMLHRQDGQTLSQLEEQVGEAGFKMTRFGVMKHLKVLEDAGLVVTRKEGRFKYHYLNVIPLQEVIDRWIEPLTQKPLARVALDLKAQLEGETVMNTSTETKPDFVLETYIRTTPATLWNALTSGEITRHFFMNDAVLEGDIKKGAPYVYRTPEGNEMVKGEFVDVSPTDRLEMTFVPVWSDTSKAPAAQSRNVYEIAPMGETCKLTILHFGITEATAGVREGWSKIAAKLKTYLETGETLDLTDAS